MRMHSRQASFELDPPGDRDPADMTIDNLARALICGGIEIYRHEDEKYLGPKDGSGESESR